LKNIVTLKSRLWVIHPARSVRRWSLQTRWYLSVADSMGLSSFTSVQRAPENAIYVKMVRYSRYSCILCYGHKSDFVRR